MKRNKIIVVAVVSACLLAVLLGGLTLFRYYFPTPGPTSDLFEHYKDNPHIRATYLRNFQVNDTLAVDVTLLQATTDSAWYSLLLDFGASDELIELYKSNKESFVGKGNKSIILYYIDINNQKKRLAIDDPNSRIVIGSLEKRTLGIFLTEDSKIKKIIRLSKIKDLKNGNQI